MTTAVSGGGICGGLSRLEWCFDFASKGKTREGESKTARLVIVIWNDRGTLNLCREVSIQNKRSDVMNNNVYDTEFIMIELVEMIFQIGWT
jgi:hypothetical protein